MGIRAYLPRANVRGGELPNRGRIQVGVGEARSRKKQSSESVHEAGPRGPAGARHSLSRVLIVGVVSREL